MALEMYEKDLEITKNALGDSHASVAFTEIGIMIGNVLLQKGDYENALLRYQKALKIREAALGPSHVSVAMTKENIGYAYERLGNLTQALSCIEEAYSIFLRSLGPVHPNTKKAAQRLAAWRAAPDTVASCSVSGDGKGGAGRARQFLHCFGCAGGWQ